MSVGRTGISFLLWLILLAEMPWEEKNKRGLTVSRRWKTMALSYNADILVGRRKEAWQRYVFPDITVTAVLKMN